MRRGVIVLSVLVAVSAGLWWLQARGSSGRDLAGTFRGHNLLLITIDTLRADRVGAYGGGHLTPTLDALAARGIRFTRAYAHAPLTLPAHASILTGLIPPAHGVRNNGTFRLDATHRTMAECLREAGYRTAAFIGAFVLDARFGLNRGFDLYDDYYGTDTGRVTFGFLERTADRVLAAAAQWILRQPSHTWFVWVHLFDPHAPYHAPQQRVVDPYDNEVAFTDAQLGEFLSKLQSAGQLDRTLIIALADHGEALGEHGESTHGLFAYDATLRIPFIIAGPGIPRQVVTVPVSQSDVLPTALDLLGVPAPLSLHDLQGPQGSQGSQGSQGPQGRTLVGVLNGRATTDRPIYFEALDASLTRNWAPLTGLVADGRKYIDLPIAELYDLGHDPGETTNLATRDQALVKQLALRLQEIRDRFGPPTSTGRVDPEVAARLRSLGYTAVSFPAAARKTRYSDADDPKGLVDLDRDYEQALTFTGAGQHDRAIELLERVLDRRPDFVAAYANEASILIEDGRAADAVVLLERAIRKGFGTVEVRARLGAAYLAGGRTEHAAVTLAPIVQAGEGGVDVMNALGVALSQLGRHEEARGLFRRVLDLDPSGAGTWNNLGLVELAAHRPAEAAAAFARAVEFDPNYASAWQGLGAAKVGRDRAGAIEAWRRAVELLPNDYDTLYNLGALLAESDHPGDALPFLRRFAREAPVSRYGADLDRVHRLIHRIQRQG